MPKDISYYLDGFTQSLGKALNFNAYKKMFTLVLIENLAYLITLIIFTIIFLTSFFIIFQNTALPSTTLEWESFFSNNFIGIGLILVLLLIGVFILLAIGLYFIAASYKLAESILAGKVIGAKEALVQAKKGYFSLLKTNILWSIISTTLVLLLLSPSIYLILQIITNFTNLSPNPFEIILTIGFILISLFVLTGLLFLLSPFVILLTPIALFENKGAIFSLKEGFFRGKINYFSKLLYLIMIGLITGAISMINYSINYPLNGAGDLMQSISGFISGFGVFGLAFVFIFYSLYFIIILAIGLIFTSAITLVNSILVVKLYQLSIENKKNEDREKNKKNKKMKNL